MSDKSPAIRKISELRKYIPKLIAEDILGVQPMTSSSGNLFNFHYSESHDNGDVRVENGRHMIWHGENSKFVSLRDFLSTHTIDDIEIAHRETIRGMLAMWVTE